MHIVGICVEEDRIESGHLIRKIKNQSKES